MFTLSFYAFLRTGEITVYGKNDENNLRLSSIKFFGNHGVPTRLEITMEHFKWHKSSRPVVLSIAQNTRDPLCACFFSVVKRRNARSPVLSSTKQGHQSHVLVGLLSERLNLMDMKANCINHTASVLELPPRQWT